MKAGEISYCGIVCADCPPMIATLSKERDELEKAAQWVKQNWDYQQATWFNIQCEGCKSGGILADFCVNCPIRDCAEAKGVDHCAECERYDGCQKLVGVHQDVPAAKIRLDQIYARLNAA